MNTNKAAKHPIESVIELLKNPSEEWLFNDFAITHASSGIVVWVGVGTVHVWKPAEMRPSFWQRRRLLKAINMAKANAITRLAAR